MKVASWNVARGLSDPDRAIAAYDGIGYLDADTIFLPEALAESGELVERVFSRIEALGYSAHISAEYEDEEAHPSGKQYIVALSRVADVALGQTRLGTRNALTADFEIGGQPVTVTGVHFDDRREDIRLGMTEAFLHDRDLYTAHALIGDLNAMHGDDKWSRILSGRMVGLAGRFLSNAPVDAPLPVINMSPTRIGSLVTRLNGMAAGDTVRLLEGAGFTDADPEHRLTMMMGSFAVANLDHCFVDNKLSAENFNLAELKGSDHKGLSVGIELANR